MFFFFFFKQKTAYEIVDCDWSSDVCSSDLTVDVGNLDEKNKKIAQADGISVKNKGDDRGDFVKIGRASCRERV